MTERDTGLASACADGQPACRASRTCECRSSSLRLLIQMMGGMRFRRPASLSLRSSLQAGAAALAHGDVADQHVVGLARQGRQRLGAAAHARDATAAQRQEHILQIGALDRMILDQEDAAGGAGFGLGHRALSWSLRI